MAVIIQDSFTLEGAVNIALADHTPTELGDGYTQEALVGATGITVNATNDNAAVIGGNGTGVIYSVQPAPSTGDYDVGFTVSAGSSVLTASMAAMARFVDADNFYAAGFLGTNANPDTYIWKMEEGSLSVLASANDLDWTAGDTLRFEVRDGSQKLFQNDVEVLSATDTALTDSGEAGLIAGSPLTLNTRQIVIDDFYVEEIGGGAEPDPTVGRLSFAEFEVPLISARGRLSFAEFEVPLLLTRGRLSFAEFEVPTVATRGRLSFSTMEVPSLPTSGRVSWFEFEVPDVGAAVVARFRRHIMGRRGWVRRGNRG